jgi:hypothetical protein
MTSPTIFVVFKDKLMPDISDPQRGLLGYTSYKARYSGSRLIELWVDSPYVSFWGHIKHRLVKVL